MSNIVCFTDALGGVSGTHSFWLSPWTKSCTLPASTSLPPNGKTPPGLPLGLFLFVPASLYTERFDLTEAHLASLREPVRCRTLPARARRVALLLRGWSRIVQHQQYNNYIEWVSLVYYWFSEIITLWMI